MDARLAAQVADGTVCQSHHAGIVGRKREASNLRFRLTICWMPVFFITGCDPVISVAGATFPVWMLCLFAGILVSLSLRPVFVATGIDEWMVPRPLVYSCLALVVAFLCWLLIWR